MQIVEIDLPGVKPVVDIEEAYLGVYFGGKVVLYGSPRNHPKKRLNGIEISSSTVVAVRGDRVETKNTIYNVLDWAKEPTSELLASVRNQ